MAAVPYIGVYINGTTGNTDGIEATTAAESTPMALTIMPKAEYNGQGIPGYLKCAIRCKEGYKVDGNVKLSFDSDKMNRFTLLYDKTYDDCEIDVDYGLNQEKGEYYGLENSSNWKTSIEIPSVTDKNIVFWMRCVCAPDTVPQVNTETSLKIEAVIVSTSTSAATA